MVEQFFTDTAREADIVLPAKTMFEQSDVIDAYWHPYIQLKQKIIEPQGQVKPESEIYWLLAQQLGFSLKDIQGLIPGPTDEEVEDFLKKKLEPFPEITLEKLKNGPVLAPGNQEVAFEDYKFGTPSGKIEILSEEANQRWNVDLLPVYQEPEESVARPSAMAKKYPLNLLTPNTKNRTHYNF